MTHHIKFTLVVTTKEIKLVVGNSRQLCQVVVNYKLFFLNSQVGVLVHGNRVDQ